MIYLDANFFVFINLVGRKGEIAREILRQIVQGKKAITSSLALDEVMWVFIKNNLRQNLRSVIERVYAIPNLEVKEVSPLVPLRAIEFMEEGNLKLRDAFHVAIMEEFGVEEIVSDDADFDRIHWINRIKL